MTRIALIALTVLLPALLALAHAAPVSEHRESKLSHYRRAAETPESPAALMRAVRGREAKNRAKKQTDPDHWFDFDDNKDKATKVRQLKKMHRGMDDELSSSSEERALPPPQIRRGMDDKLSSSSEERIVRDYAGMFDDSAFQGKRSSENSKVARDYLTVLGGKAAAKKRAAEDSRVSRDYLEILGFGKNAASKRSAEECRISRDYGDMFGKAEAKRSKIQSKRVAVPEKESRDYLDAIGANVGGSNPYGHKAVVALERMAKSVATGSRLSRRRGSGRRKSNGKRAEESDEESEEESEEESKEQTARQRAARDEEIRNSKLAQMKAKVLTEKRAEKKSVVKEAVKRANRGLGSLRDEFMNGSDDSEEVLAKRRYWFKRFLQ